MDPNEIAKHIPEIASVAKIAVASVPFTAIVKRMLGPAADEVAEMWRDQVRLYRYERQLKCVEKAERMAQDAGFTPKAVPLKLLFPLLEGASFEEDEDLHTMWAALLANAASPENAETVRPGYISILKHMSPDEGTILNYLYDKYFSDHRRVALSWESVVEAYMQLGCAPFPGLRDDDSEQQSQCRECIDSLHAHQLIVTSTRRVDEPLREGYRITFRGIQFVLACRRPPKPK